jgi:hypothetical protein
MKFIHTRMLGRAILGVVCVCFLSANPVFAQKPAPQKAAGGTLDKALFAFASYRGPR